MCFLAQPGASTRMSQTTPPVPAACVRESPGQLARLASPPELGKPNTTHLFGSASGPTRGSFDPNLEASS